MERAPEGPQALKGLQVRPDSILQSLPKFGEGQDTSMAELTSCYHRLQYTSILSVHMDVTLAIWPLTVSAKVRCYRRVERMYALQDWGRHIVHWIRILPVSMTALKKVRNHSSCVDRCSKRRGRKTCLVSRRDET